MTDPRWYGYVTIFTDASFCAKTHAAGWAAWIKHQGKTMKFGGTPVSYIINSNHAEFVAAVNGIFLAIKYVPEVKTLHLVSDCDRVVMAIGAGRSPSVALVEERKICDFIFELVNEHKVTIKSRHVRAHVRKGDRRNYVNNWCDAEAKRHMRHMRDQGKYS